MNPSIGGKRSGCHLRLLSDVSVEIYEIRKISTKQNEALFNPY
jgi:hypothetical protein